MSTKPSWILVNHPSIKLINSVQSIQIHWVSRLTKPKVVVLELEWISQFNFEEPIVWSGSKLSIIKTVNYRWVHCSARFISIDSYRYLLIIDLLTRSFLPDLTIQRPSVQFKLTIGFWKKKLNYRFVISISIASAPDATFSTDVNSIQTNVDYRFGLTIDLGTFES